MIIWLLVAGEVKKTCILGWLNAHEDACEIMKNTILFPLALDGGGTMEKTKVVLKEETVPLLFISTGIEYSAHANKKS